MTCTCTVCRSGMPLYTDICGMAALPLLTLAAAGADSADCGGTGGACGVCGEGTGACTAAGTGGRSALLALHCAAPMPHL